MKEAEEREGTAEENKKEKESAIEWINMIIMEERIRKIKRERYSRDEREERSVKERMKEEDREREFKDPQKA